MSNTVTGELLDILGVSAAALPASYGGAGDVVTFIVSVTNSSAADISGVTLRDSLGEYAFGTLTLTPLRTQRTRSCFSATVSSRLPLRSRPVPRRPSVPLPSEQTAA